MAKSLELKDMLKGDDMAYVSALDFLEQAGILDNKDYFKKFKEIIMIAHHNGYIEGLQFAREGFLESEKKRTD